MSVYLIGMAMSFPHSIPQGGGRPLWKESRAFLWPRDVEAIIDHLQSHANCNLYFSPQVYEYTNRRSACLKQTQSVLWADLDTCPIEKVTPKPSVAWESSPGRYAALWFLDKEYPLEEILRACKGIAYEYADLGADKGGWDATQVLRVPGSVNYKYGDGVPEATLGLENYLPPVRFSQRRSTGSARCDRYTGVYALAYP